MTNHRQRFKFLKRRKRKKRRIKSLNQNYLVSIYHQLLYLEELFLHLQKWLMLLCLQVFKLHQCKLVQYLRHCLEVPRSPCHPQVRLFLCLRRMEEFLNKMMQSRDFLFRWSSLRFTSKSLTKLKSSSKEFVTISVLSMRMQGSGGSKTLPGKTSTSTRQRTWLGNLRSLIILEMRNQYSPESTWM